MLPNAHFKFAQSKIVLPKLQDLIIPNPNQILSTIIVSKYISNTNDRSELSAKDIKTITQRYPNQDAKLPNPNVAQINPKLPNLTQSCPT